MIITPLGSMSAGHVSCLSCLSCLLPLHRAWHQLRTTKNMSIIIYGTGDLCWVSICDLSSLEGSCYLIASLTGRVGSPTHNTVTTYNIPQSSCYPAALSGNTQHWVLYLMLNLADEIIKLIMLFQWWTASSYTKIFIRGCQYFKRKMPQSQARYLNINRNISLSQHTTVACWWRPVNDC